MPVAMSRDPGLDFSFSGLKTALVYLCRDLGPDGVERAPRRPRRQLPGRRGRPADREARAGAEAGASGRRSRSAAASPPTAPLREAVAALCEQRGVELKLVPIELCTDNAAMIGSAARFAPPIAYPDYLAYDAFPAAKRRPA